MWKTGAFGFACVCVRGNERTNEQIVRCCRWIMRIFVRIAWFLGRACVRACGYMWGVSMCLCVCGSVVRPFPWWYALGYAWVLPRTASECELGRTALIISFGAAHRRTPADGPYFSDSRAPPSAVLTAIIIIIITMPGVLDSVHDDTPLMHAHIPTGLCGVGARLMWHTCVR